MHEKERERESSIASVSACVCTKERERGGGNSFAPFDLLRSASAVVGLRSLLQRVVRSSVLRSSLHCQIPKEKFNHLKVLL